MNPTELNEMFVVVSYDVIDDRRRKKLSDILKDYGQRVQYSIFECDIEKKHVDQMIKEASAIIDEKQDSLRIYHLCSNCVRKIESYGSKNNSDIEKPIVI